MSLKYDENGQPYDDGEDIPSGKVAQPLDTANTRDKTIPVPTNEDVTNYSSGTPTIDNNSPENQSIQQRQGLAQQPIATNQPTKLLSMLDLIRKQEPVEDTGIQARASKAALMDSIGQVFGNFAGAIGGSRGANVPQLSQDENVQKLYGILDANKNKYDILHRQWQSNMGNAAYSDQATALQQQALQAKAAQDQRNFEAEQGWKKLNYGLGVANLNQRTTQQAAALAETHNNAVIDQRVRAGHLGIDFANSQKPTSAQDARDNAFQYLNPATNKAENYNSAQFGQFLDAAHQLRNTDPKGFGTQTKGLAGPNQIYEKDKQKELVTSYLNYNYNKTAADNKVAQGNIDAMSIRRPGVMTIPNQKSYDPMIGLRTTVLPGSTTAPVQPPVKTVRMTTPGGKVGLFDPDTKKFIKYENE